MAVIRASRLWSQIVPPGVVDLRGVTPESGPPGRQVGPLVAPPAAVHVFTVPAGYKAIIRSYHGLPYGWQADMNTDWQLQCLRAGTSVPMILRYYWFAVSTDPEKRGPLGDYVNSMTVLNAGDQLSVYNGSTFEFYTEGSGHLLPITP